mmetsp:Transcript_13595/g.37233  ORF Transcript_13595/g.37233 Transcript_13595/m.37233 type:complete len:260 (+) Transcript_13595:1403-2182(+)
MWFRRGQPSMTVFGSKPPKPIPWIANALPARKFSATTTCANPRTPAFCSRTSRLSRAFDTLVDRPRVRPSSPSSTSATTQRPRPFFNCVASLSSASLGSTCCFGGCVVVTFIPPPMKDSPTLSRKLGGLLNFLSRRRSVGGTGSGFIGQPGRHKSCGLQLLECFLSWARSSIADVARSSRIPPNALPQSTCTCLDSMYATSNPSIATATSAKYHLMTNASVVHSKNPARPRDQWKNLHVGRHDGARVKPRTNVEKLSAA